jgi:hypothetical protein
MEAYVGANDAGNPVVLNLFGRTVLGPNSASKSNCLSFLARRENREKVARGSHRQSVIHMLMRVPDPEI